MKAKPILLKPHEVRGILNGRKTQMRQVVDRLSGIGRVTEFQSSETPGFDFIFRNRRMGWNDMTLADVLERCPLGRPGDLLWVRETWGAWPHMLGSVQRESLRYRADGGYQNEHGAWRWRSPLHMPRRLSRITLEVTDVRVERLQDISEEDARAEGIELVRTEGGTRWWRNYLYDGRGNLMFPSESFRTLWESINGIGSWVADPWVWVVEFRPHLMNIDQFLKQREAA